MLSLEKFKACAGKFLNFFLKDINIFKVHGRINANVNTAEAIQKYLEIKKKRLGFQILAI